MTVATVATAAVGAETPEPGRNPPLLPVLPPLPAKTINVCTEAEAIDLGHMAGAWMPGEWHGDRSN
jgi:hypothetical protein